MNVILLYLAVVWLAIRDRWYMSKWNPWGAGSPSAHYRSTQSVLEAMERHYPAALRTATGGIPPSDPKPPVP